MDPAYDPYVIAVGAMDSKGTSAYADDTIADFSTRGSASRRLDILSPGRSIVSLRAPGSTIDTAYPAARVDTRFFKGSGSSQATAVTAGAVALLIEKYPTITPDRVKQLLKAAAWPLTAAAPGDADIPLLDIDHAGYLQSNGTPAPATQSFPRSTGTGSLESARGTFHVYDGTTPLAGENDIFGTFSTAAWATASGTQTAWVNGLWMGRDFTGNGWVTAASGLQSWQGRAWSGRAWSGRAWSGRAWSSETWVGETWS
jgi:serine protease AprX